MTPPDDSTRTDRTALRGYADALSRAFEFALTTAIFLVFGIVLDHWLGTSPILVIVFGVLGIVGQFVRMWLAYDGQMRQHEAALPSAGAVRPTVPRAAVSSSVPRPMTSCDRERAPLPSISSQVVGLLRRRGRMKA